jgi:hypothetical protein
MAERLAPSTKPVTQKLLLRSGARALVLNAPDGYLDLFPADVHVERQLGDGQYDFVQLFATERDELLAQGPRLRKALQPQGVLWVSYPKGKALPTDLNRDIVRTTLADVGLEVVSQVAIDETWSALRAKVLEK